MDVKKLKELLEKCDEKHQVIMGDFYVDGVDIEVVKINVNECAVELHSSKEET